MKVFCLVLAGAAGTLSRYYLSGLVQRSSDSLFPWGTLLVNIMGCFLFGFIAASASEKFNLSKDIQAILLIGFLGAFTTFSSFAFETFQLARQSYWMYACLNFVLQNMLGFLGVFMGMLLSRAL